jgi:hypothetical protein
MSRLKITTKTSEQIAAEFAATFKDIKPVPPAKPVTQEDRLAPYRKEILKQRRRGLTWKQIADGMSRPPISESVSERTLKAMFEAKKDAAPVVAPAGTSPVAKPPRARLILDPLTGKPVIVPPAN